MPYAIANGARLVQRLHGFGAPTQFNEYVRGVLQYDGGGEIADLMFLKNRQRRLQIRKAQVQFACAHLSATVDGARVKRVVCAEQAERTLFRLQEQRKA